MTKSLVALLSFILLFLAAEEAQAAHPFRPRGHMERNIEGKRQMLDNLSAGGDNSICRRHLKGYGWDVTAQARCPQAGIFLRPDGTVSHSYRGTRPDADIDLEEINEVLAFRRDQETRQNQPQQQKAEKPSAKKEDASEVWVNQTGCKLFVKDIGDQEWTTVPPGRQVRLQNGEESDLYTESSACTLTSNKIQPGTFAIGCEKKEGQ